MAVPPVAIASHVLPACRLLRIRLQSGQGFGPASFHLLASYAKGQPI